MPAGRSNKLRKVWGHKPFIITDLPDNYTAMIVLGLCLGYRPKATLLGDLTPIVDLDLVPAWGRRIMSRIKGSAGYKTNELQRLMPYNIPLTQGTPDSTTSSSDEDTTGGMAEEREPLRGTTARRDRIIRHFPPRARSQTNI